MSDETSVQAAVATDVELFHNDLMHNEAETDNSGTDRASSPEIRPRRLSLHRSFNQPQESESTFSIFIPLMFLAVMPCFISWRLYHRYVINALLRFSGS